MYFPSGVIRKLYMVKVAWVWTELPCPLASSISQSVPLLIPVTMTFVRSTLRENPPILPMKELHRDSTCNVSELLTGLHIATPAKPSTLENPPGPPSSASRESARTTAEVAKKPLGPICDATYRLVTVMETGSIE